MADSASVERVAAAVPEGHRRERSVGSWVAVATAAAAREAVDAGVSRVEAGSPTEFPPVEARW